ncbi:glutathione transferase GstA [Pseudomonas sp. MWU16-30322]|uniref:glutathione transferase GstA n=1 Tax=Pseudomonas sp. MWU16-30322 TaxID=2878092 RepID=UPI001CFC28BF|nr:glutathione transferase GstA [Pseudomonas sp. MWU16-30322]
MKLYYAPQACSLAPHIVLRELKLPFVLIRVDNRSKRTASDEDFLAINPKGYVAALQLDNGAVLTEGAAILQYLADLQPQSGLAPAPGSFERLRLQEWLNFISSEIHGGFGALFDERLPAEPIKEKLFKRFAVLVAVLEQQEYLLPSGFSVADALLFVVLRWAGLFGIELTQWPALARFQARIERRPTVIAALAAEAV